MDRRTFLQTAGAVSAAAATTSVLGPGFWRSALAQSAVAGPGPYGPISTVADANGLFLPAGFTSRIVAVGGEAVLPGGYVWHSASDGAGTYPTPNGGWILTSNQEATPGGVGAIEFGPTGAIIGAFRLVTGTRNNCAGGQTPWGTWFTCEEVGTGHVFETNPYLRSANHVELPQLGTFAHEAAAVDPRTGAVYLTEDATPSALYRWMPAVSPGFGQRPNFANGSLAVLATDASDNVTWLPVPDPTVTTGNRPAGYRQFVRGEGIWYHGGCVYWCCTTTSQIFELDIDAQKLELLYSTSTHPGGVLTDADNITAHARSGDLFITEDSGTQDVVILSAEPDRQLAVFASLNGHDTSETTGPVFNPAGDRLYFSSQRGSRPANVPTVPGVNPPPNNTAGNGVIFEISGPFRTAEVTPPTAVPEIPFTGALPLLAAGTAAAALVARMRRQGEDPSPS